MGGGGGGGGGGERGLEVKDSRATVVQAKVYHSQRSCRVQVEDSRSTVWRSKFIFRGC